MEKNKEGRKGPRMLKGFLYSAALFLLLTGLAGVLLRFTALPESGAEYYMLGILVLSCLFFGLWAGSVMGKRGLLYGGAFALVFLLLVLLGNAWLMGVPQIPALLQAKYLLCVLGGGLGGILGVHLGG